MVGLEVLKVLIDKNKMPKRKLADQKVGSCTWYSSGNKGSHWEQRFRNSRLLNTSSGWWARLARCKLLWLVISWYLSRPYTISYQVNKKTRTSRVAIHGGRILTGTSTDGIPSACLIILLLILQLLYCTILVLVLWSTSRRNKYYCCTACAHLACGQACLLWLAVLLWS